MTVTSSGTTEYLARDLTQSDRKHPPRRPRDAAALLLIDRNADKPRVLVGKRGKAHVFMPELYVFPGGRRDAGDSRILPAAPLDRVVEERLQASTVSRFTPATARGLAVAAAREMMEEAAISLTPPDFSDSFRPDLSKFRFLARAITPPGQSRRFDTRFFACFTDEIGADPKDVRDSDELHDLTWLPVDSPDEVPLPRITRVILSDLAQALGEDRALPFDRLVPFYYFHRGRFARELI